MTTVAHTDHTVQFNTALRGLADRARTRYAGEAARIERGLVIALNGAVTLHTDGTASVQSASDPEVVYHVNGHCDCPDASRAPEGRCKHRWAKCLVKKARTLALRYEAVRHFATYTAPDGTEHQGIATPTGNGWLFVAEDGLDPLFASSRALTLCGQVDLAEAALADDTRVAGSRVLTLLAR
jgi:hypothetical protein